MARTLAVSSPNNTTFIVPFAMLRIGLDPWKVTQGKEITCWERLSGDGKDNTRCLDVYVLYSMCA